TLQTVVKDNESKSIPVDFDGLLCFACLSQDKETQATLEYKEIMYCGEHNPVKPPVVIVSPNEVFDLAESLQGMRYVMDLETTGLNPRANKVITIALGTPEQVWIIDMRRAYAATAETKRLWCEALQALFHRDDIEWAGHNLKFDWSFM